jgi:hypothetical protein
MGGGGTSVARRSSSLRGVRHCGPLPPGPVSGVVGEVLAVELAQPVRGERRAGERSAAAARARRGQRPRGAPSHRWRSRRGVAIAPSPVRHRAAADPVARTGATAAGVADAVADRRSVDRIRRRAKTSSVGEARPISVASGATDVTGGIEPTPDGRADLRNPDDQGRAAGQTGTSGKRAGAHPACGGDARVARQATEAPYERLAPRANAGRRRIGPPFSV